MFACIACHFPISLCQILHLATINVIIVTKVAGGNPIEFLLPEPSGTALFIFIQKQPLCRPSSQTVGVDLCIERFHHRHRGTARFFTSPRSGCSGFSEPDAWPEACGTVRDIEKIKLVPDREITTPKLEKLTEQEYYNDLKGEALAIRALLLFDMTRIYGYPYLKDNGASLAVPIIDKVVEDKNIKPSRNTTAQCYKAITDDLTDAVKLLRPVKKEGKINKWGAMTLLSRVYLYMGNDKEAYDVAAEAIKGAEKQGYKLWTNDEYAKIWATPFNSELLFEIVNLTTDSPGKSSIGYLSTKYNLIATEKYWKDYMKDNSDDVRSQMVSTASSSKPYCLKYPAQGSKSYEDANIPVFRLSELYLNAAEAAIKRNDIPNTRKYLKPIYARTGKDLDAVADEDINLDLVLEQRRIEFWGEGQRFFDLLRNNKKVIREDYLSEVPNEAVEFDWSYYKIVLPVPNHEMEYNENMVQNPEYELH